jgi:homospermidine synthase
MSALECIGSGKPLKVWKIKNSEITSGIDELGVLLYGHSKNAYWYGSSLDVN